jgi:hypothetical protein
VDALDQRAFMIALEGFQFDARSFGDWQPEAGSAEAELYARSRTASGWRWRS